MSVFEGQRFPCLRITGKLDQLNHYHYSRCVCICLILDFTVKFHVQRKSAFGVSNKLFEEKITSLLQIFGNSHRFVSEDNSTLFLCRGLWKGRLLLLAVGDKLLSCRCRKSHLIFFWLWDVWMCISVFYHIVALKSINFF